MKVFNFKSIGFAFLFACSIGGAANEVGNGGHAFVCDGHVVTADVVWTSNMQDLTFDLGDKNLSVEHKLSLVIERLKRVSPKAAAYLEKQINELWDDWAELVGEPDVDAIRRNDLRTLVKSVDSMGRVISFVSPWVSFRDEDLKQYNLGVYEPNHWYRKPSQNCKYERLAVNSGDFSLFIDRKPILIRKAIYEKLDNDSKAAIILHELLSFNRSSKARKIANGGYDLFSGQTYGYEIESVVAATSLLLSKEMNGMPIDALRFHILATQLFKLEINGFVLDCPTPNEISREIRTRSGFLPLDIVANMYRDFYRISAFENGVTSKVEYKIRYPDGGHIVIGGSKNKIRIFDQEAIVNPVSYDKLIDEQRTVILPFLPDGTPQSFALDESSQNIRIPFANKSMTVLKASGVFRDTEGAVIKLEDVILKQPVFPGIEIFKTFQSGPQETLDVGTLVIDSGKTCLAAGYSYYIIKEFPKIFEETYYCK